MDITLVLLLAFLEMTFIFVGFCMLHSQRKVIGSAAFYLAFGMLFLFSQLVFAADLQIQGPKVLWFELSFPLNSIVFFMPCLATILLLYLTEGTLAIQRLIIGILVLFGIYFYLADLTRLQSSWEIFGISQGIAADTFQYLLYRSRGAFFATFVSQVVDLFLLPIIYQRLRNARWNNFFSILGALLVSQLADSLIFALLALQSHPDWFVQLNNTFLIRSIAALWFAILLTIYLKKIEQGLESRGKSALELLFAFFGGYSRSKRLERNLMESEGRYKLVLENASEMVFLMDNKGMIIDANRAAARLLAVPSPMDFYGRDFFDLITQDRENLRQLFLSSSPEANRLNFRYKIFMQYKTSPRRRVDVVVSPVDFHGSRVLIVVGRDITEESRLAEEKEILREQLAHSQRLESLGKLAGGIAHDFNNYVHAILGHIDVINLLCDTQDEKVRQHLGKIEAVAEQAGKLTGQLLGFARKGKYQVTTLELAPLIDKSIELFMPSCTRSMEVESEYTTEPKRLIRGDAIQLQQVLVNLFINARDALEETPNPRITVSLGNGETLAHALPLEANPETFHKENYYFISIADNGCGMSKETLQRIFEPFFTTKPIGKGTGMGLSMVYGTITHHHGYLQVQSEQGKGSIFTIFLPKYSTSRMDNDEPLALRTTPNLALPEDLQL